MIVVLCTHCSQTFAIPKEIPETVTRMNCPHCGEDMFEVLQSEIDALIEQCQVSALRRAAQLPPLPEKAAMSVECLWEEVRSSYILGQYAAALTLGCAFLEFVLNTAMGKKKKVALHKAIMSAKDAGLIDKDTADQLKTTDIMVRNRYAHGNYHEITGANRPVTITNVTFNPGGNPGAEPVIEPSVSMQLHQLPFVQAIEKKRRDVQFSRPVLQYIRMVSSSLIKQSSSLRREVKSTTRES